MTFNGDVTQRMPESVQREVIVALQAQAALEKQIERITRNYLIKKGKLEPSATKEEFETAKAELSPETINTIAETTKNNSEDLFLQMAEQQYELDALKNKNTLTGLANRRMADKTFELLKEHSRQDGNNEPMAVVDLDLDGFKMINDTFGHDVGNEVLKLVGRKLKAVRSTDLTIHFSGDEFGLILTGLKPVKGVTVSQTVERIVAKLISSIEETKEIELLNGKVIPLSISASAGFKIVEPNGLEDFFTTNEQADSALKFAKKCKGVAGLKLGSTRVVDADKSKEDFLKEKNVPLEVYERSEEAGDFNRPATDLLSRTAKKQNKNITPQMIAEAEIIMREAVEKIKKIV